MMSVATEVRQPLVSVIIEGYNEVQIGSSVDDTLAGLLEQDYPLERIEVVLLGSTDDQSAVWSKFGHDESPFLRVTPVDAQGMAYYDLKNLGGRLAQGEILAFVDSDVVPGPKWVSSIVAAMAAGADATAGLSRVQYPSGRRAPPRVITDVASSLCFGHTIGVDLESQLPDAGGLVTHNMGVRADVFRAHHFDTTRYGRNIGPLQLYEDLRTSGARVSFVSGQRVEHSFKFFTWFLYPFHTRVGYEEHVGRREVPNAHSRWLMRTGPLEPVLTAALCVRWDVKTFLRFARVEEFGPAGTALRMPVLLAMSLAARISGMTGAIAGIAAPERMKVWAETH
jgi:glycosyltransferase involved in cell wall biosynthesis